VSRYQEYEVFDEPVPFGAPIAVSVVTPLMAPTDFQGNLRDLCVNVVNLDPTNPVTVTVTPIPDGVHPDPGKATSFTVAPGKAGSSELGPGYLLRQVFEVTAQTTGPGFPVVNVLVQVIVFRRQT
jgi:hypothetical protein